jgi:urease accessory protein UreE
MNPATPPQELASASDSVSLLGAHLEAVRAAKPYANDVELANDVLRRSRLTLTTPGRIELTFRLADEVRRQRLAVS